jgi:hypothetical protein
MEKNEEVKKPVKEKIDYDGYYIIDVVFSSGDSFVIPARGYNLKSWIKFETGLISTQSCVHRKVEEFEWMKHHWTSFPWADSAIKKNAPDPEIKRKKVKRITGTLSDFYV